jgi:hypothetical protein
MFLNITNHPSSQWSLVQIQAAVALGGQISDIPFPAVKPTAAVEEIAALAEAIVAQVASDAVCMVQGEWSLTYAITKRLRAKGVTVVVTTSERRVREQQKPDGTTEKVSIFDFCGFRLIE